MTTLDLITRAEFIFKKYEKYTKEENKDRLLNPGDAFSEMCIDFELQIATLIEKSKEAEKERNRTALAQMNAEIRRDKAKLKAQLPDLAKMAKKKARKLPEEKKAERAAKIESIETALDAVPDGTAPERRKRRDRLLDQNGPITLNVDFTQLVATPLSMEHSKESTAFRQEYLASKAKQDAGLDQISKGLRTLKDLGSAMSDELKKQDPLLDNIDDKTAHATTELRTANTKLKSLLQQMRQPHKLCLDMILLAVLLGIGSFIFTLVKPSTTASLKNSATSLASKVTGTSTTPAATPAASSPPPGSRHLLGESWAWEAAGMDARTLRLLR